LVSLVARRPSLLAGFAAHTSSHGQRQKQRQKLRVWASDQVVERGKGKARDADHSRNSELDHRTTLVTPLVTPLLTSLAAAQPTPTVHTLAHPLSLYSLAYTRTYRDHLYIYIYIYVDIGSLSLPIPFPFLLLGIMQFSLKKEIFDARCKHYLFVSKDWEI
jgi:hypothetical protein